MHGIIWFVEGAEGGTGIKIPRHRIVLDDYRDNRIKVINRQIMIRILTLLLRYENRIVLNHMKLTERFQYGKCDGPIDGLVEIG